MKSFVLRRSARLVVAAFLVIAAAAAAAVRWFSSINWAVTRMTAWVLPVVQRHPLLHHGLSVTLNVFPDLTSTLLALAGLSYLMPNLAKSLENRRAIRLGVVGILVIVAISAMFVNEAKRQENDQKQAVRDQNVDRVREGVSNVLEFLVRSKGTTDEAERRRKILETLRGEYVLAHPEISPGMLTGSEAPPDTWVNARLKQLGEHWAVKSQAQQAQVIQMPVPASAKQAELVFSFREDDLDKYPKVRDTAQFENGGVKTKVTVIAVGDVSAQGHGLLTFRVCNSCKWLEEPAGARNESGDGPRSTDRVIHFESIHPNVQATPFEFHIGIPASSKVVDVVLACYYACDNCPPKTQRTRSDCGLQYFQG